MLTAMAHRTHGRSILWSGEGAALASGAVARAPGGAPVTDGPLTLVGDVRLDNAETVAVRLGLSPALAHDRLALAACTRWGEEAPRHLDGDFAFAVWDARDRTLFCARDGFGVRPFHYALDGDRFVFASEAKGVLAARRVRAVIDMARAADFLSAIPPPETATAFVGVHRLGAGQRLKLANGALSVSTYWRLEASDRPAPRDAPEGLRDLFTAAVARRAAPGEGGLRVGAMLSGGLDSSSIACVASDLKLAPPPLPTLSLVFDEAPKWSERPQIEAVLARGGFAPTFIGGQSPFSGFEALLDQQDGLFYAPALGTTRGVSPAAAELGLDVVLDGHGGDEVISLGHPRMAELAAAGKWREVWKGAQGLAAVYGENPILFMGDYVYHFAPGAYTRRRWAKRLAALRPSRVPRAPRLISEAFAAAANVDARLATAWPPPPRENKAHHLQTLSGAVQPYAFEILDRANAAAGIEGRYPFWDRQVVEFCLNLDAREKLDDGWTRVLLRRGMEGVLPPSIQWRRDKLDFSAHIIRGMLGPDKALLDEIIQGDAAEMGSYVNLDLLRAAYRRMQAQGEGTHGSDMQLVWRAVAFGVWLRKIRREGLDLA